MSSVVDIIIQAKDATSDAIGSATSSIMALGNVFGAVGVASGVALAAVGVAAFKLGEDFSQSYDAIRVGTGQTGAALDGLKTVFQDVVSDVPTSFENASAAVTGLSQRLGLTGAPLEQLSEKFINLARITKGDVTSSIQTMTRVFGDWSIKDQSKAMDEMFRASQSTGIGIDRLAKSVVQFGAPLRGLGFSFEESVAMMAKWEKEGVNQVNVMGAMKKAYGEFAKTAGAEAPAAFRAFMAEIQKAPSASAAAALAIEKLGVRNGPDFAAAVQEGRFAYGDLVNTITNGTDTIDSAAKDTEHFGEKFTMFVNRMKVAAEPLASGVFDAVGQAIDRMSPAFQEGIGGVTAFIAAFKAGGDDVTSAGFAGELEKLGLKARRAFDGALPGLQGFADAVSGLSSSVLPALKTAWEAAFGAVESTVKWIGEHQEILDAFKFEIGAGLVVAVYALASAMVPLIVSVYSLAAGVVAATWPFLLIGGAITAVVAGVIWAYRNLGFFRAAVDGVATAAMWLWGSVLVPVAGFLAGVLGPAFSFVAGLIGSFASNIGGWLGNIPGALGGVVEFFEGLPGVVIGFLGTLWTTISGWVVGVATTLPGLIAGWYMAFMQWVIDTIVNLPGQLAYLAGFIIGWIIGEAINLGIALVGWANAFGNWALGVIVAMPGWLANVAAALWGFMVYVVTELPAQLLGWYLAFANWVFSVAGSIGGWLVGVAAALWGWVMSTGAALPGQLFGWFMQFANWAGDLAGKLPGLLNRAADSILNWIRGIPGYVSGAVSSMIDIGKNIVNSLWDGVNSLKDWITDKVKKFASGLIDGIKSVLHIGSPSKDMIEIGKFMAQGLGVGFTGEASNLQHSIDGTMGGLKFDMKGATYARGALGNTVAGDFYTTHPGAPRGTDVASFAALARDMAANGGGMGPTHNWYVQGSIRSDQDLMALVRDELLKQGFSGTPVPTPAGV